MGQRFCQHTKLLPQLPRLQQFRLVPEGEHPAEHAVCVRKTTSKAQPTVRFLGETIRPVLFHQPPAAGRVKENRDLILGRKDALWFQVGQGRGPGLKRVLRR